MLALEQRHLNLHLLAAAVAAEFICHEKYKCAHQM